MNGWGAGLEGTLPLPEALRSGKRRMAQTSCVNLGPALALNRASKPVNSSPPVSCRVISQGWDRAHSHLGDAGRSLLSPCPARW